MGALDGILGAGISAAASLYANSQNLKFQQQANEQNIQLQRDINQQNLDNQWKMWDATNNYNSPAQQMARYREAGLNPNLIYGQSNTAQSMNVGTAQAPQVQAKKVDFTQLANVASTYMSLISQKKAIEKQQLDNDLLSQTLNDKITQSSVTTRQMILNTLKTESEIKRIGVQNYVDSLDGKLKEFELSLSDIKKRILISDSTIKSNQAVQSAIDVDRSRALLQVEQFQINIEMAKYSLLSAQTEHELAKMGLTIQEKENLLKKLDIMDAEIKSINKDIERKDSEIEQSNAMTDYYIGKNKRENVSTAVDAIDKISGVFGKIGNGLRTFKFLKLLNK